MHQNSDPSTWVDRYGDALYRYALLRVREPTIAEDLVQETFLAALTARQRFAGDSSEKTWLTGILKHKIIDYFRKNKHEQSNDDIDALARQQDACFDERGHWLTTIDSWDDPEQSLQQQAFHRILSECVAMMPAKLADLFILHEFRDMDNDSLCKALDISSTNNMWVMMSRARMRLRDCLDKNWFGREKGKTDAVMQTGD